ncbi:MAG TPA: hypothetical protein PKL65_05405 [Bacteroidales bacterium]|jgi:uncharacterized membrane protein|nr:hypothetical protein [Bacteroidales bacterium]HNR41649.1 hypothetical protein [Bacteroidales bacterium]HPM17765.1 hypothetical protein [Bacteroidales bacterium]HQG77707.1 hypothetical protein [Bacteroidales bacterium]
METEKNYNLIPTYGNSFRTGWKVMFDNFLRLLLVVFVLALLTAPLKMFELKLEPSDFHGQLDKWSDIWEYDMGKIVTLGTLGMVAAFAGLLALAYTFLAIPVVSYGGNMIFVQAVRRIKPEFDLLIRGFRENYLHIVLSNLLLFALIVLGCFALIIPGIIIACRLVFVPYIVMDKKLDPIEAVELSWKLTKGYGWRIFAMGLTSVFIMIFGLILFIVGIFPAIMWISSSFASLYQSVLLASEKPAEIIAA